MDIDGIWIAPPMFARLCQQLGVHRTTVARWIECGRLPKPIKQLLDIPENGELGELDDTWRGWRLVDGGLVSPLGQEFTPGEVQSIPLRYQQICALRRENRELKKGSRRTHAFGKVSGAAHRVKFPHGGR